MLRSHKAVVGSGFFNFTYFILPILFTVTGIILRSVIGNINMETLLMVQCFAMMYEASTEYFGYGPIYRRNNFGMEYLKTSVNGMKLFERSILTDSILRIARSLFYTIVPGIVVIKSVKDPLGLILVALVLATVSVWSVNLTRYVTMYGYLMIIVSPLLAVGMLIDALGIFFSKVRILMLCIVFILLITGVLFTQKTAQKKIRLSYMDV